MSCHFSTDQLFCNTLALVKFFIACLMCSCSCVNVQLCEYKLCLFVFSVMHAACTKVCTFLQMYQCFYFSFLFNQGHKKVGPYLFCDRIRHADQYMFVLLYYTLTNIKKNCHYKFNIIICQFFGFEMECPCPTYCKYLLLVIGIHILIHIFSCLLCAPKYSAKPN